MATLPPRFRGRWVSAAEGPPRGYNAVFWFVEMIAFSFVLVAVEQIFARDGDVRTAGAAFAIAVVLSVAGIKWPRIRESLITQGARPHVVWFATGALTSTSLLVVSVLVLLWSGPKVLLGLLGMIVLATVTFGVIHRRRHERARLQGHRKGLVDYKKDFRTASARNLKDTARLTKEVVDIGTRTAGFAKQLQSAKSEQAQEVVFDRTAQLFRRAAARYRRRAEAVRQSLKDFTDATSGILGWLEETGKQTDLQAHIAIIDAFRASIASAHDGVGKFRQVVLAMPNMSQRLNASRAELVESIDISLGTTEAALLFCDQTLTRLQSVTQAP